MLKMKGESERGEERDGKLCVHSTLNFPSYVDRDWYAHPGIASQRWIRLFPVTRDKDGDTRFIRQDDELLLIILESAT